MRTTLTIDDDVLDRARSVAARRHAPFRLVVNEALRAGLQSFENSAKSRPYRTQRSKLGLKAGRSLDNIQELLAALAIEHGCELISTDSDFSRFPGIRWRNPLS